MNRGHFLNTYGYIRNRQEPGTVVWSHRADENWIDDPSVGILIISAQRKNIQSPR